MATVRIEYFGMDGAGRTLTEAKKDAGRKIEAALSGSYTPEVVSWRGWAILVFRTPDGWHSGIIAEPDGVRGQLCHGSCKGDRKDAIRSAQLHLADLGWTEADGLEPLPFITDRADVAECRSKATFQLRCIRAKAAGLNSNEIHAYGCGGGYGYTEEEWAALVARVEGQTVGVA